MTEENEMRVAMTFVNSPKKSTRRAAQELSLPGTSLRRLMRNLNLKPYRPRLLHGQYLRRTINTILYTVYLLSAHLVYASNNCKFRRQVPDAAVPNTTNYKYVKRFRAEAYILGRKRTRKRDMLTEGKLNETGSRFEEKKISGATCTEADVSASSA